jgi:hypothetical protein
VTFRAAPPNHSLPLTLGVFGERGNQPTALNLRELACPLSQLTSQPGRLRSAPPLSRQQTRSAARLRIAHAFNSRLSLNLRLRLPSVPWAPDKTPRKTSTGGWGAPHQKLRALLAKRHQPTDPCVRCGHPLGPMGPWLHLDHNDSRTGYLGFSHGRRRCPVCGNRCNLRAAGLKAKALQVNGGRATASDAHRW